MLEEANWKLRVVEHVYIPTKAMGWCHAKKTPFLEMDSLLRSPCYGFNTPKMRGVRNNGFNIMNNVGFRRDLTNMGCTVLKR